jgi:hypothetical protein
LLVLNSPLVILRLAQFGHYVKGMMVPVPYSGTGPAYPLPSDCNVQHGYVRR